jgi:DNA repair protein RadC
MAKDSVLDEQIHSGRRERLREAFVKHGLETFNEKQVLEFALGFVIPRIDTNPIAHRLIKQFGSLNGVIEAHPDKLKNVEGVGAQASVFLSFLRQLVTYSLNQKTDTQTIKNTAQAVKYFGPIMAGYSDEVFCLACLDKAGKIILHENTIGDIHKVNISLRNIMDAVLRVRAATIIVAHNHIAGNPTPSEADIQLTRQIINLLEPLEITLMDHVIFGNGAHYSFLTQGLIDVFKREQKAFALSKDYEDMI